jgi:hypothetical protein
VPLALDKQEKDSVQRSIRAIDELALSSGWSARVDPQTMKPFVSAS